MNLFGFRAAFAFTTKVGFGACTQITGALMSFVFSCWIFALATLSVFLVIWMGAVFGFVVSIVSFLSGLVVFAVVFGIHVVLLV